MSAIARLDNLAASIAALPEARVKNKLRSFRGRFKLDFTDDYLNKLSIDRLRHILLAAMLAKHRKHH